MLGFRSFFEMVRLNLGAGTLSFAAVVLVAVSAFGQQPTVNVAAANPASTVTKSSEDDRYRIGPGDVLDIQVYNRPNLSRAGVRVEGNGMFRMPLIESEIEAACKTEGEL